MTRTVFSWGLALAGLVTFQTHAAIICLENCATDPTVSVGSFDGGDGTLTVNEGSQVSTGDSAFIGYADTGQGSALVHGENSRLDTGGETGSILFVGSEGGNGSLTIFDGGAVTSNGFDNNSNFGDARAFIGSGGQGQVVVNTGGSLTIQDESRSGGEDGIQLGRAGSDSAGFGVLNVFNEGSSIEVNGNGAFINVASANTDFAGDHDAVGSLAVGGGNLTIQGNERFGLLSIGRGARANGNVTVNNGGTINVAGNVGVVTVSDDFTGATGNTGTGALVVSSGGTLNIDGTIEDSRSAFLTIGQGLGSGSVLVEDGGVINVGAEADGLLQVSFNTANNSSQTGELIINDTGVVNADLTLVGNNTDDTINGVLGGTGTLNSNTVVIQRGGLLDPGQSPGIFTINGDLSFTEGGRLLVEIGGLDLGERDLLRVLGIADFSNAIIEYSFINDFVPTLGDAIEWITAGSLIGFDSAEVIYSGLPSGFGFDFKNGMLVTTQVPEPSTLFLIVIGVAVLVLQRNLKRTQ